MQDHPNRRPAVGVAAPGTPEHDVQRLLLLELVVDPPEAGDVVVELSHRLDQPVAAVEAAAIAIEGAGLARRSDSRVFASVAALSFEALWRVRPWLR